MESLEADWKQLDCELLGAALSCLPCIPGTQHSAAHICGKQKGGGHFHMTLDMSSSDFEDFGLSVNTGGQAGLGVGRRGKM